VEQGCAVYGPKDGTNRKYASERRSWRDHRIPVETFGLKDLKELIIEVRYKVTKQYYSLRQAQYNLLKEKVDFMRQQ
jgi:hypothetical protein